MVPWVTMLIAPKSWRACGRSLASNASRLRRFAVPDCSETYRLKTEVQLCLDQQDFRLPDGIGLSVPHVEALPRLNGTIRIAPTCRQKAVAPGRCEQRLDPAESPRRNTETTRLSMTTATTRRA